MTSPSQPAPLLDLNTLQEEDLEYGLRHDSFRLTGIIERPITKDDVLAQRGITGEIQYHPDGRLKYVLVVPVFVTDLCTPYIFSPIKKEGSVRWAVHGILKLELERAMGDAGLPPGTPPETGARITIIPSGSHEGIFRLVYDRPDEVSLKIVLSAITIASLSPIERPFWDAHQRLQLPLLHGLIPQYPIGSYLADFALPDQKICVELDGFLTHSSTADITKDRQRHREIEARGWRVIRFGGQEVHQDAEACVRQAAEQVKRLA